jgi:pyruvate formate lyase activating enzyme
MLRGEGGVTYPSLPIAGMTPFTTIDFPEHLSAVLYTQGCEWRCRYCYNHSFWPFSGPSVTWESIVSFLHERKGFLDGVVFCGGEPTAHEGLAAGMRLIRWMGYKVALHTTGMHPERLQEVILLCDWIGMDVKAPFKNYEKVTRKTPVIEDIKKSIALILKSGIAHEFRTTVHPALLSEEEILNLGQELSECGAQNYALQGFRSQGCCDETLSRTAAVSRVVSPRAEEKLRSLFKQFTIRQAS